MAFVVRGVHTIMMFMFMPFVHSLVVSLLSYINFLVALHPL